MGIRGLATFVAHNHGQSFIPYRLHKCSLVIDGNSVASQLYVREFGRSKANHCAFGGDYDEYARIVKRFFNLLCCCEVNSIVIFDGGREPRKSSTSLARLKEKISATGRIRHDSCSECPLPLLMLQVFKWIAVRSGAVIGVCDFEADEDIAALARALSCPLLSFDSDFYIHAVPAYIPFPTLATELTEEVNNAEESSSSGSILRYLECSTFSVNKFLSRSDAGDWRKKSGGMQRILQVEVLPLIAALLGNDYVMPKTFRHFISKLPIPKSKSKNYRQRAIVGLLEWLRLEESLESAIKKILNHTKKGQRKQLEEIIRETVNVYVGCPSELIHRLNLSSPLPSKVQPLDRGEEVTQSDLKDVLTVNRECEERETQQNFEIGNASNEIKVLEEVVDISSGNDSEKDELCFTEEDGDNGGSDSDGVFDIDCTLEQDADWNKKRSQLPEWFLERHRKGILPPSFMDILMQRIYICPPQVEDQSRPHSHAISFPVLSAILRLLTPTLETPLFCWTRVNKHAASLKLNPLPKDSFWPPPEDLLDTPVYSRIQILLQSLNLIDDHEEKNSVRKVSLESLPSDWRLIALSLAYWRRNSSLHRGDEHFLIAACFVIVVLRVVDTRAGPPGRKSKKVRKEKNKLQLLQTTESSEAKPFQERNFDAMAEKDNGSNEVKMNILKCNKSSDRRLVTVGCGFKCVKELLQLVNMGDCLSVCSSDGKLNQLRHIDEDQGRTYFLSSHQASRKRPRPFNVTTVHCFSELQSVIMHVGHLNSLLGEPYVNNAPHHSFSGTILYNAHYELNGKSCSGALKKSIWEVLLGTCAPSLENLMDAFFKCVLMIAWGEDTGESFGDRKTKRRKRNRKKAVSGIDRDVVENSDEDCERNTYDPENKFSLLNLIEI